MIKHSDATIYITNVCNLNCDNCNYFNNYAMQGHYRWHDYKDIFAEWAQRIDFMNLFLLGGEPMTNPDFLLWVHGVADLWPRASMRIITNGTLFDRWPSLYQELQPYQGRVYLTVSGHNEHDRDSQIRRIQRFLAPNSSRHSMVFERHLWNRAYNDVKDISWPPVNDLQDWHNLPERIRAECVQQHHINAEDFFVKPEPVPLDDQITFIDHNQVRVSWSRSDEFVPAAVKYRVPPNVPQLHDSDPEKAIKACTMKKCHIFVKGQFYKCPVTGILPEFLQQFKMDITQDDRELVQSYKAADISWSDQELTQYLKELDREQAIPQCKFCPEHKRTAKFWAGTKKIKIERLST